MVSSRSKDKNKQQEQNKAKPSPKVRRSVEPNDASGSSLSSRRQGQPQAPPVTPALSVNINRVIPAFADVSVPGQTDILVFDSGAESL